MRLRTLLRELFLKWRNPERFILERKIFPSIKDKKILLVGVGSYTKDYPSKLKENDVTTLDINPYVKKYGSSDHIIGDIIKFNSQSDYDIIFLTGVIGYGVDTDEQAEKALKNCNRLLKKQGILVVSLSQLPEHKKDIRKLKNYYLFQPIEAFGFKSLTKVGNSVYEFLLKK